MIKGKEEHVTRWINNFYTMSVGSVSCCAVDYEQVAEMGEEIVGMIRGCIKTVTCGKRISRNVKSNYSISYNVIDNNDLSKPVPVYSKVAYILGLRISPSHR